MNNKLQNRVLAEAEYIVKYKATVRKTARIFGVGKSTVHKDMVTRLQPLSNELYEKVKQILQINLSERHIRGGLATKNKYLIKRSLKKHNA